MTSLKPRDTSVNKKTYAVFEFANFSETGLKKFAKQLENKGCPVASITATNKITKRDGIKTKRAVLFFENAQKTEIVIGESGDIVSIKINGTMQPIGLPKNLRSFAVNVTNLIKSGQAKFDKTLQRRLKKIKVDAPASKPASRTNAKRIEEAQANFDSATSNLSGLRVELNEINESISTSESKEKTLTNSFNIELERNKALKKQLSDLAKV